MSDFDEEAPQRSYTKPYSPNHPIPTVKRYREHQSELDQHQKDAQAAQEDDADQSKFKQATSAVKHIFEGDNSQISTHDPYPTGNRNAHDVEQREDTTGEQNEPTGRPTPPAKDDSTSATDVARSKDPRAPERDTQQMADTEGQSATESAAGHHDARRKRKDMKHIKRDDGGRQVTDPVTHLPIIIRDSTEKDLKQLPENVPSYGSEPKTYTGFTGASKEHSELTQERDEMQDTHQGMEKLFPPPSFTDTKAELVRLYQFALTVGLGSVATLAILALVLMQLLGIRQESTGFSGGHWSESKPRQQGARVFIPLSLTVMLAAVIGGVLITGIRGWLGKKVEEIWDEEVWDADRRQETEKHEAVSSLPESVAWLNSLFASVWPLINPDLFTSIADMLEDVMQASLPKLVRMVSVDDLGQGSEAFRILGVRWLPTGAASQTVDEKGNLKSARKSQNSDRAAPNQGQVDDDDDDSGKSDETGKGGSKEDQQKQKQDEQEKEAMRQGMEAEQGDFVNMELAFAYRARSSGKSLKAKASNAHLYLKFYLPGNICVPVWVELRGIVGTMRLRLQLTPDPPFFSLCTLTFLGQPRADLSCVPLSKHNLNIMDVPLISGFVQSAIDAALAEYVAPKSLTLDLKDMLVGDDFKKDTTTRGVIAVLIKSAKDFKEGDGGFGPMKGSSDGYVTVSWGKFGKPMASTRIIVDDQLPRWEQWAYLLVGPDELNAEEMLRLQLWDSDKYTADDDLGRVEVDLKDLMHNSETKNKMCDREDRLTEEDLEKQMPGTMSWAVGYFEKTRITPYQFEHQKEDRNIKSIQELKERAADAAEKKLREATAHDESKELDQQKAQEYKEREDSLIISSPPDPNYPSGMLSIQVHNITGLEVERMQKRQGKKDAQNDADAEDANGEDVPSSYCSIILNHKKIYETRTKPKNAKPFFNAGTERFIKDWRTAEIVISVRDSREGEKDALLGVIYLPLEKVFEKRSQTNETYPLAGGIGYGRARISMVFRSCEMHAPETLLGWDYGTLEVKAPIKVKSGLSDTLKSDRLRLSSNIGKAKFYSEKGEELWKPKHDKSSMFLAVHKRYACPLTIEFRKSTLGPDSTPAFAVLWLKDIPDEEEQTVTMKVWKGSKDGFKRASSCVGYAGLQDGEKPLGEIEVTLKFWRGLSGWHQKWADRAGAKEDVSHVMEVLDVVNDVEGNGEGGVSDNSDDSSGDEGEGDSQNGEPEEATMKDKMKDLVGKGDDSSSIKSKLKSTLNAHNDPNSGKRGPMAQVRDYKDHREQLHRKHRGVMQWRAVRKMDWMSGKAKEAKGKMEGIFQHRDREPGVETEV